MYTAEQLALLDTQDRGYIRHALSVEQAALQRLRVSLASVPAQVESAHPKRTLFSRKAARIANARHSGEVATVAATRLDDVTMVELLHQRKSRLQELSTRQQRVDLLKVTLAKLQVKRDRVLAGQVKRKLVSREEEQRAAQFKYAFKRKK